MPKLQVLKRIGKAIAIALAKEGVNVILVSVPI
jgi:NAD(P)-dependent dehydrogenase (short-subunit alcohol dehydrogenase family)